MKRLDKQKLREAQASLIATYNGNANGHASGNGKPPPDTAAIAEQVKAAISTDKEKSNPFPLKAMPKAIQAIVEHWRNVYLRPIEYHGTSILAATSAALGNNFQVEHVSGSIQPLAGWFVIVGPPSSAKSPIMRACMGPLFDMEDKYSDNLNDDLAQWEMDKAAASQRKEREPPKPQLEQRIVNDATIESLIKVLMQKICWKGVMIFKDEFMALVKSMNAYKTGGGDLEHYLSMWSGMPITLNRTSLEYAGRVKSPFVGMFGSIQPGVLHGLTDGGKVANGFLFRLLFGLAEDAKIPKGSGEIPRPEIANQYNKIIQRLIELPSDPEQKPIILRMDADAFKAYAAHKERIEQQIINCTDDEDVQSLYGKMIDYTLRIAALLEMLEFACGGGDDFYRLVTYQDLAKHRISKAAVERSITITDYFTRNSLKILLRTESPVAALPKRQQKLYEKLPTVISTATAIEIGDKLEMSDSTVKRLIYNKSVFKQQSDGNYRKLFT